MITFKQFLSEEKDISHTIESVVESYFKNCTQWKDVASPLYRISDSQNSLRERVPRTRIIDSTGGTRDVQKYILDKPEWAEYPDRTKSIFCSTTPDFEVGTPTEENLLMIYPFDNVKIAILKEDTDFNYINVLKGSKNFADFSDIENTVEKTMIRFYKSEGLDFGQTVDRVVKDFSSDGKFSPSEEGKKLLSGVIEKMRPMREHELEQIIYFANNTTPKKLKVDLATPNKLKLNKNKTRECWFSGKYLSIPNRYHDEFVNQVKLRNSHESK